MKLITPQGKQMIVTERERDLMRVLRSSFGLLGVVHEVVLRVQPLTPVKIDYQVLSLKEFSRALRLHHPSARAHCGCTFRRSTTEITVERRTLDESASLSRSGIWQIRNSVMRNVLPAFGSTVGSVLAAPGLPAPSCPAMQRALRATLDRSTRGVVMYAHEWMRDLPIEAWKARHTYSLWAFPQADFPKVLADYFAFCKSYYKEHRYRCNVVSGASRLHQDKGSLVQRELHRARCSPSSPRPRVTKGWDDFLIDFNDFASGLGGTPTFNQTRALQPEHVAKSFGERVKLFRALRQRTDPLNRLRNSYFAYLLG